MKIKKPAEEIEVCDFCQRGGFLQTCIVCKKQYCLTCQGIMSGCMVEPPVCKKCDDREDVIVIVSQYADQIVPIIKKRNNDLGKIRG